MIYRNRFHGIGHDELSAILTRRDWCKGCPGRDCGTRKCAKWIKTWLDAPREEEKSPADEEEEKRMWKPKYGEKYYIPSVYGSCYIPAVWQDGKLENEVYEAGIVCKSPEEATVIAKVMLTTARTMLNAFREYGKNK